MCGVQIWDEFKVVKVRSQEKDLTALHAFKMPKFGQKMITGIILVRICYF